MTARPRRLRDLFDPPQENDRRPPQEAEELIHEVASGGDLDVEEIARELHRAHRRCWHEAEDELKKEGPQKG